MYCRLLDPIIYRPREVEKTSWKCLVSKDTTGKFDDLVFDGSIPLKSVNLITLNVPEIHVSLDAVTLINK